MTLAVTPHLNFAGEARAALAFYAAAFDGETIVMTYAQMGRVAEGQDPDAVIWGQVESADGFRIMAYDVQADRAHDRGTNAFYVSVRGDDVDQVRTRWARLAEGATILHPIGPAPWSAAYGMLTDRFGVTWVIDVAPGGVRCRGPGTTPGPSPHRIGSPPVTA